MNSSTSLADRAYGELRSAIVNRRLTPGAAIVEADLAEMLGISRTPVREALRRCELEGYLVRAANGKRTVSLPTVEMVEQLFVIRIMIEEYGVRLAATRISDAELARLDQLVEEDFQALDQPRTDRLAELNGEIHGIIVEASRNRTLSALMRSFQGRPHGLRVFAVGDLGDRQRFVEDHRRLVGLLRDGDAEGAATVIRAHLEHAREVLIGDLELER
jgi:DNA-binding GntR family transcriptional regulator